MRFFHLIIRRILGFLETILYLVKVIYLTIYKWIFAISNRCVFIVFLIVGTIIAIFAFRKLNSILPVINETYRPVEFYVAFDCSIQPEVTVSYSMEEKSLIIHLAPSDLNTLRTGKCGELLFVSFPPADKITIDPDTSYKICSLPVEFIEDREDKWLYYVGSATIVDICSGTKDFLACDFKVPIETNNDGMDSYSIHLDFRKETFYGMINKELEERINRFPVNQNVLLTLLASPGYELKSSIPPPESMNHNQKFPDFDSRVMNEDPEYSPAYKYEIIRDKTDLSATFWSSLRDRQRSMKLIVWSTVLGIGLALIVECLVKIISDVASEYGKDSKQ